MYLWVLSQKASISLNSAKNNFTAIINLSLLKVTIWKTFSQKSDLSELFTYEKNEERVENFQEENSESKDGLDFFKEIQDPLLREQMKIFRKKEILDEDEMLDFIRIREDYET